jgi:predicted permease
MVPKKYPALTEKYIPYLGNELQKAVEEGNSPVTQVYIRALGNLAHPMILLYLEPYLEGQINVSSYQRLLIVSSLNKLAQVYPEVARPVLLKLYENLGETQEIRVVAAFLVMETKPSATILQRLAEFTELDTSKAVAVAVQSAIKSAANRQDVIALRR